MGLASIGVTELEQPQKPVGFKWLANGEELGGH